MARLTTVISALLLSALIYVTACNLVPALTPLDWPAPSTTASAPCDTIVEYTSPPFVVGYMEIDEELFTDPIYIVGNQMDTIYQDELSTTGFVLDAMFSAQWPQYEFDVYVNDSDSRLIAVVVHGTNNRQQFYLKAQVRYNGVKHYFGWASQYFVFSGALTADEYLQIATDLPSVDMFNFRRTEFDSTQYDAIARKILGECKKGRYWADFRWGGPFDPALYQAFEDAGWELVTHN